MGTDATSRRQPGELVLRVFEEDVLWLGVQGELRRVLGEGRHWTDLNPRWAHWAAPFEVWASIEPRLVAALDAWVMTVPRAKDLRIRRRRQWLYRLGKLLAKAEAATAFDGIAVRVHREHR